MNKGMHICAFAAYLMCSLFTFCGLAETRETTGYGTGDDQTQAIIDAKMDAILNFGGTFSAESSEQHDILVRDEEKSVNEAYLISYEVIDLGESVEGTYVRIKARVSDDAEYTLKDGKANVRGEGTGQTEDQALVMALCDAILESGAKIKVAIKSEKAQLTEHSVRMDGGGVIVSSERERKKTTGSTVTAYCRIVSEAESLSAFFPRGVEGTGTGINEVAAEMNARRDMLLNSGSEFSVHALYEYGELKSLAAERRCDAYISTRGFSLSPGTGQAPVEVHARGMRCGGEDELYPQRREEVEGIGIGKDFTSARKAAICDAFLNRGCHATLNVWYDMGRQMEKRAEFDSSFNYFGERIKSHSPTRDGYVVAMTVSAGGRLPEIDDSMSQNVEAVGYVKNRWYLPAFIETFWAEMDAWQGAVDMVFGCPVDVSVSEQDEAITNMSCSYKHSIVSLVLKYYTQLGYVDECQVISKKSDNGAMAVGIQAIVKKRPLPLWAIIAIVQVSMVLLFVVVKWKLGVVGLTIIGILTAYGLFATGHWAFGISAIALGVWLLIRQS